MRRMHPGKLAVLLFMAIGVIYMLFQRPGALLIPVIVLGAIFLLYKFPPARFRSRPAVRRANRPKRPSAAKPKAAKKNIPFRVIEGGKDDDEDIPKYH